jgi:hypothetical protein
VPAILLVVSAAHVSAQTLEPPASLIGTWALNTAKSTLPGPAPKSHYRTFDLAPDGLLCTYGAVGPDGKGSFGFWKAKLDDSATPEFSRAHGATPTVFLHAKRVDDRSIYVSARRDGKEFATVSFFTSPDGKMLTQDMTIEEGGKKARVVRVYDKQP